MSTNSFDREFIISDMESAKKLIAVITDESPKEPLSKHPFSKEDRDRGEELLRQCPLRCPR